MNVLAFDCAGRSCSAAVLVAARVGARRMEAMERGQAESLMPVIESVMADAHLDFAQLDLIAVATGPGSFTGVRIALAAARGLALASGKPALGITSFAAIAAGVPVDRALRPLVVALDSKREDVFLQCFSPAGEPASAPLAVAPAAAADMLPEGALRLAGDAASRLAAILGRRAVVVAESERPDPAVIARVAADCYRPGESPPLPVPLYLRPPDTTRPRPRSAVQP